MSELIQWPRAKYWTAQWNPVIGCKPCSPACANCYAAAWAKRFGQSFEPHVSSQMRPPRKGIVFCGNMTDLFGEWLPPFMWMDSILLDATDPRNSKATYLWLTKRADRMCDEIAELPTVRETVTLGNQYFGFTAENQEWYENRMSIVNECFPNWANLWISAEPLLGPIDFRWDDVVIKPKVVITGCESGPNRRPCKIEWVESIVEQCTTAGVPAFVKQLDIGGKCVTDINKFPEHLRIRQVPWTTKGEAK